MRFVIFIWLLTCSSALSADYEAVFHREDTSEFGVTFLEGDRIHHRLELGKFKPQAHGFWGKNNKVFWITTPVPNEKYWHLMAFDVENKKELTRINIGKRLPNHLIYHRTWSEKSENGQFIFALTNKKNVWHLETYDSDSFSIVASVKLDKGAVEVTQLTDNRLLVISDFLSSKTSIYLIDGSNGAMLFQETIKARDKPQVSHTKSKNHVIVVRNEKRELTHASRNRALAIIRYKAHVSMVDSKSGKTVSEHNVGYDITPFYQHEDNEVLYFASRNSLKSPGAKIWEIRGEELSAINEIEDDCTPKIVLVREAQDLSTLVCEKLVAHFSSSGESVSNLGIKARSAFYDESGKNMYLMETLGSEVGHVSLEPLTYSGKQSTGRGDVKFAQGVSSVLLGVASAYAFGYAYVPTYNYNDTAITINDAGTKIYAMNGGTRDVTIISTKPFEKIKILPTGNGPIGLSRFKQSEQIFALSYSQVTVIDPSTDQVTLELKDGNFVGASEVMDRIYFAGEKGIKVISISELNESPLLPEQAGIYLVVPPKEITRELY